MKIRLHGTPAEVDQATKTLLTSFHVVSVSEAYPDRGASTLVRVYLETRIDVGEHRPRWQTARTDQPGHPREIPGGEAR